MKGKIKAKEAIRISFEKLLKEKEYYKISVKEIAENANVTRQIFYYYFKNISELLNYYAEVEIQNLLKEKRKTKTLSDAYIVFFNELTEMKDIIKNLTHQESLGVLRNAFEIMSRSLHSRILTPIFEKENLSVKSINLLLDYYKFGLASSVYKWVNEGMEENPKEIVKNLSLLVEDNIIDIIKKFKNK